MIKRIISNLAALVRLLARGIEIHNKMIAESLEEFIHRVDAETRSKLGKGEWGFWSWDKKFHTLDYRRVKMPEWEIDLKHLDSAAAVLDEIVGVFQLPWMPKEDKADFIFALNDIFHLHSNFASFHRDVSKPGDYAVAILEERMKWLSGEEKWTN